MKIKRNSWLGKAYLFNSRLTSSVAPMETDLCHFMQAVLLELPFKLLLIFAGITCFVIVPIGLVLYLFFEVIPGISMELHYALWSEVVVMIVLLYLVEKIEGWRNSRPRKDPSLLRQLIKAKKQKICPLVEII
jgi:hypothetical protein